jgi:S-DNA-T family DNA segregation ATPase FtsK/SpoIIIE
VSTEVIKRPARRAAPALPTGDLPLEPPPAIPQPTGARWQQYLMMLPMLAGTVATAMMFGGREGGTYTYVVGGIFGLSTLGMLVMNLGNAGGPRKAELMTARRNYLRYLAGVRRQVRATITDQRESLNYRHPDPQALWGEAMSRRLWERRATDADFGVVRVGLGPQLLGTRLVAPSIDPTADLEPVTAGALHRFIRTYSVVADLPISIALRSFARVVLTDRAGGDAGARGLARAMIGQLATFHAPDDLVVAACVPVDRRREWEWLKWLPHALHPTRQDAVGPRRLLVAHLGELDDLLADLVAKRPRFQPSVSARGADPVAAPHILIVVDGADSGPRGQNLAVDGGLAGVTLMQVGGVPPRSVDRSTIVLSVADDGSLRSANQDSEEVIGRADRLSLPEVDSLARRLAPVRLSESVREQAPLAVDRDLTELLGIPDIATAELAQLWAARSPRELLRMPIGTAPSGAVVHLDLKEAAQDGMGPHGLIVGTTGSGKSELLRTLVLGLAATHSSETLNFVLVDFKGGATFATLDRLPHTSAVITNLADELPLVDRMYDALTGELTRRQELLRSAGNFASLRDYDRARATGAALAPLPSLLIICDEFAEMLNAKPDFINIFTQMGRIGRSIGVHVLLATQRLEEHRLRGLESNLGYRIALRTQAPMESRAIIGTPEAAELPSTPGHGFLAVGTEALVRFKAAYVSGPYRRRSSAPAAQPPALPIYEYGTTPQAPRTHAVSATAAIDAPAPSLLEVIVDRLAGQGAPAHRVWLPPLHESPTIDELLGALVTDPARGITTADTALHGALTVPFATVDNPAKQRRDVARFDLSGANGHAVIVGGPQSGKSTAVRSLVTALALTHTPLEVQVYCLDFGGGSLTQLRDLPHVGGVASRLDAAQVRRTVGEVATLLADRERWFAERGIDSIATYRRLRRRGDLDATVAVSEDGYGDVFLVVDGWTTLRAEFEELDAIVVNLATRGLSYGVHVVGTATRWSDFRMNVKDLFGSRLELRLGEPSETSINRTAAANVPQRSPGRGLAPDGLHLLTALPQVAGHPPSALTTAIAGAWPGPKAPAVRMLPSRLPYAALLTGADSGAHPLGQGFELPIGIAESDLKPVTIDFATEPHLLVFGDESGKTALLHSLAESITRRFTPEQATIVLVDYRRTLLGAVTTSHLIAYATDAESAGGYLRSVASYMDKRRPGPDVTPEALRNRSWWEGPDCFVLVDDYDLVATNSGNPLLPLIEHLAQARDNGLHLIVARRAGGAGRALFDPVLQRLRELGSPGIVMSGERDEGALVGTVRPSAMPPGRGVLVTRRQGARLVQLAHLDPPS